MGKKNLEELLAGLELPGFPGGRGVLIDGICYDSRQVQPGFLFVCIHGFKDDGHRYIPEALRRGAAALVVERTPPVPVEVPAVRVPDARRALSILSDRFYDHPSGRLTLIGITGTQGKTTTAYLTEAVLAEAGFKTGLIGTVVQRVGGREERSVLTTPESLDLQRLLADSVRGGISHVVMEVSSHALALNRVGGCDFDMAIFTNLTSDHLDLHGTTQRYLEAKASLFDQLGPDRQKRAIVNLDDPHSGRILDSTRCPTLTYGVHHGAHLMASDIRAGLRTLSFLAHPPEGQVQVRTALTGAFNVYNAMAALGVGLSLGIDLGAIAAGLERVKYVPGRFELVEAGQDFLVIVDFAHTAAAMEQLLATARTVASGSLITVFGCPGERDATKRPVIGQVVTRLSDYKIITTDTPAGEDPLAIAHEIKAGVARVERPCPYEIILDRGEAIAQAVSLARPGDAVVLAGKGHEEYQIMKTGLVPFSDRTVALEALRTLKTAGPRRRGDGPKGKRCSFP